MEKKELIATYYTNARELVRQNNPRAARAYVLKLLNEALVVYHASSTILMKAKNALFLERWIAVSRDLYNKGITDYVLECFSLLEPKKRVPEVKTPKKTPPAKPKAAKEEEAPKPASDITDGGGIDMSGLVDDAARTQGWCADIFEANKTAVVEIFVSSTKDAASGTGFIISRNGYLLTNDHVVYNDSSGSYFPKIKMSLKGGKKSCKVDVLFSDKSSDVALCRFDPNDIEDFSSVKRIKNYSDVKQGADCLVIGNAFGMGLAPFSGIIRFTKDSLGNIVYTAPSNPGDSGAPVFNRSGECIGINKSQTLGINGMDADAYANATPMDKIDSLLKKWTENSDIVL